MVIEVEKKTFGQKFKEQMTGFAKFMYNKETGEVMGRDGSSWGMIVNFKTFYWYLVPQGRIHLNIVLSSMSRTMSSACFYQMTMLLTEMFGREKSICFDR